MNSLKGHLLVATPELLTPFFTRTVILMFEHSEGGAAGVVLNRQTEANIQEISRELFQEQIDWDKLVNLGGPVPGPLVALHALGELADQEIIAGVYLSMDAAKLLDVVRRRVEPSLIVANYAGWGPGQLEGEIAQDSWFSLPATAEYVFWSGEEDLWESVVERIGSLDLPRVLGLGDWPVDPSVN